MARGLSTRPDISIRHGGISLSSEKEPRTGQDADAPLRRWDAAEVAANLFHDYNLEDEELRDAASALWPYSGGPEYEKVFKFARKAPNEDWEDLDESRRRQLLHDAMYYHLSYADWERLSLRTGAALVVMGKPKLGAKIIELTADGNWKPPSVGGSYYLSFAQIAVYAVMFVMIGIGGFVSGVVLLIAAGAVIAFVGGIAVYLADRPKWQVKHEQREARFYAAALRRVAGGTPATDLFAADGSLRSPPA